MFETLRWRFATEIPFSVYLDSLPTVEQHNLRAFLDATIEHPSCCRGQLIAVGSSVRHLGTGNDIDVVGLAAHGQSTQAITNRVLQAAAITRLFATEHVTVYDGDGEPKNSYHLIPRSGRTVHFVPPTSSDASAEDELWCRRLFQNQFCLLAQFS